jgi:hypothetical protein
MANDRSADMKRTHPMRSYRIEELVAAAYKAAGPAKQNPLLTAMIVSKVLEHWLARAGRADLLRELQVR